MGSVMGVVCVLWFRVYIPTSISYLDSDLFLVEPILLK